MKMKKYTNICGTFIALMSILEKKNHVIFYLKKLDAQVCVGSSVECLTLDFSSGHGSEPSIGRCTQHGVCLSLSLCVSLYLSQRNKILRDACMAQLVGWLPSAQVMVPVSWDRVRHWAPCSAGSLLLPLPASPPLCALSLSL